MSSRNDNETLKQPARDDKKVDSPYTVDVTWQEWDLTSNMSISP